MRARGLVSRRASAVSIALLLAALASCDRLSGPGVFTGSDITGAELGRELRLRDHHNTERRLADFRGQVVAVYFGFTHCPDLCPTALHDLARAAKLLGGDAKGLQVLFVSVDPKRDTPAVLAAYLAPFNPAFLGLSGDDEATRQAVRSFHAYADQKLDARGADSVEHSGNIYVFDRLGRTRLLYGPGVEAAKIAADVRLLLDGS